MCDSPALKHAFLCNELHLNALLMSFKNCYSYISDVPWDILISFIKLTLVYANSLPTKACYQPATHYTNETVNFLWVMPVLSTPSSA